MSRPSARRCPHRRNALPQDRAGGAPAARQCRSSAARGLKWNVLGVSAVRHNEAIMTSVVSINTEDHAWHAVLSGGTRVPVQSLFDHLSDKGTPLDSRFSGGASRQ